MSATFGSRVWNGRRPRYGCRAEEDLKQLQSSPDVRKGMAYAQDWAARVRERRGESFGQSIERSLG